MTIDLPIPTSPPRLTRIHHRSLLLTMLGSIILFANADLSPSFFLIGLIGSLIGHWYAIQGPSTISRLAINAILAVVVTLGLINALKGNFSVSTFAFFSLLLMILKLFDLRTPRDHGQILVLSLALIIASALTSSSMFTGIGVFLMGFIFIRSLMIFRLYALIPPTSNNNHFTKSASINLRSIQTVTGFVCTFVALLIFLIMPRSLGNNALGQWGGTQDIITTGFTDDVQLGRPGRLTSSPTPVLRMTIHDRNDQSTGTSESRAIYLRGSVLTQYKSGRWIAHTEQNIPTTFRTRIVQKGQSIPVVSDSSRAQWIHEYHFTFDRPDQNFGYLFSPWKPLELKALSAQSRLGIDPDTGMILLATQPVHAYRIRATDPDFLPLSFPTEPQRPPIDQSGITPQITALATQILSRIGLDPDPKTRPQQQDIQAVRTLENHLRTQYQYSLISEPVPQNRDATEWFLFDRRQGHCEYYASALTLLTRSIGIPARVITGYVAAEYNEVSGSYTVRQSNAHAWVEANIAPDFWRTFDGTPQSDFHEIHEPDPSFFNSLAMLYEAIEHTWITAVVGYDSDTRSTVLGDLPPTLSLNTTLDHLQNRLATGRTQLLRQALITAATIFALTMTLGLTLIFLTKLPIIHILKSRLRLLFIFSPTKRTNTHTQLIAIQLTTLIHTNLKNAGFPCPLGTPLKTHLNTIKQHDPIDPTTSQSTISTLQQATDLLYHHHFANPTPNPTNTPPQTGFIDRANTHIKSLR